MTKQSIWQKHLVWGVKLWQLLAFLVFHFVGFAFFYWLALYLNVPTRDFNPKEQVAINFILKFILIIPAYGLIFYYLRSWKLIHKVLLHLVTGSLYVIVWINLFYAICDSLNIGHLTGAGSVWDYYISALIYVIQFSIFHIYDAYVQLIKQKEKENQLITTAYKNEMNALKAQIQPHFLFNTLNSISASVPPTLEHTREMIAQLADTFRYGLRATMEELVPLKDELKFIQDCLNLEKERFGDRMQLIYEINERLLEQKIPPMLLQPLIENAVKHGIAKSVEGGSITISISAANNKICFAVKDTGAGLKNKSTVEMLSNGIGLSNTQKRLYFLFGESIQIQPNEPRGAIVSFAIPMNKTHVL
jgi:two-component system, LytTR family, sensor kinase